MSCCLCSGDYTLHTNRSDLKFMGELFADFTDSDNLCVNCYARLDNLIDYANCDLPTEALKINEAAYTYPTEAPDLFENVYFDLPTEAPHPNMFENVYPDLTTEAPHSNLFEDVYPALTTEAPRPNLNAYTYGSLATEAPRHNFIENPYIDLTTEALRPNLNQSVYTYANLTTEAPRLTLIESAYTDVSMQAPRPKKAKQANNKLQKIRPKKEPKVTQQGGFTICKLSAEQLNQITSTSFGHLTNHIEIQTIDPGLLTNLNNMQFIQVTEGHMHALQRSMIPNI